MHAVGIGLVRRLIDERAPDDYEKSEALEWAFRVFANMITPKGDDVWRHISQFELGENTHKTEVFWRLVGNETAFYIQNLKWLHSPQIDWLLADSLCFGELEATMRTFGYPRWYKDGKFRFGKAALSLLAKAVLWGLWLVIAFMLYSQAGWMLAAWVAVTGWTQWRKARALSSRGKLVQGMVDAYETLNTAVPSWTITWEALRASRDAGAGWPPELYRLVEDRLHTLRS